MMINKNRFLSLLLGCGFIVSSAHAAEVEMNTAQMQAMDKITGRVSLIDVSINSEVKFGSFSIVVRSCKTRPPEETPENFAFVDVVDQTKENGPINIFKGWMVSSSPALNAVEHPIYDVWLIKCINVQNNAAEILTADDLAKRDSLPMLGIEKKLPDTLLAPTTIKNNAFEENISGEPVDLLPPMILEESSDVAAQEQVIKIDGSEIVKEEAGAVVVQKEVMPEEQPEVLQNNTENAAEQLPEEPQNLIQNIGGEQTPASKEFLPEVVTENKPIALEEETIEDSIEDLEKELSIEAINN